MRLVPILLIFLASGCLLDNISPTRKLNDSIRDLNDASRWGRIDLAVQYVEPTYQTTFLKARHRWGRQLRIADTELVRLDINSEQDQAIALMAISWYRMDQMTLRYTVVRQVWIENDGHYLLSAEAVSEGDALLMQTPSESVTKAGANVITGPPQS